MIKNTSGLAVQPCRLHERFYYHARLLYYILRQKARGFFARGLHPRGDLCKDIVPAPTICRRSALHPGEFFAGLVVPAPTDAGAPPRAPGDFLMRRKSPKTHQEPPGSWTSGTRGRTPLDSPAFCPSGIGRGNLNPQASSGASHPPSHGLKAESVPSMKPEEKTRPICPLSSKWQIGLGLWQKVARRDAQRARKGR